MRKILSINEESTHQTAINFLEGIL